jgi:hypothetical protein
VRFFFLELVFLDVFLAYVFELKSLMGSFEKDILLMHSRIKILTTALRKLKEVNASIACGAL